MATRTKPPHAPSGQRAAARQLAVRPPQRRDGLIVAGTLVLALLVYAWSLGNATIVLGDPQPAWYATPDLSPVLDHTVDLVLHLGCVAVVFAVVRTLTGRPFLGHFCAVAFAVHPMNVDAVTGVAPRGGLLATLFVLGSLVAYVAHARRFSWVMLALSVVLGAAAGLAQVYAAVLPLLLFLVDAYLGRLSGGWRLWLEKLPFVAVSVGVVFFHGFDYTVHGPLVVCAAIVTYLWKLFLPVHLAMAYAPPAGWFLYAAPVVLVALAVSVLWIRSARRIVVFGLGFFLVAVLPGAVLGGYADNGVAYLPYVGLFLILGHFVGVLMTRYPADVRVQSIVSGLLAGVVLVFSVVSVLRVVTWHDAVRITTSSIDVEPGVADVYLTRAAAEYAARDYPATRQDAETALRLDPGNAWAYVYRGRLKYANSDFTGALDDFDSAIDRAPDLAVAYVDRGRARSATQDSVGALSDFSWAIGLDRDLADAYHQRGIVEIQVNNEKAAVADFDRVLQLRPTFADAYYYRGVAKARLKDLTAACADLHAAQGLGQKQAGQALSESCQGK
jgi:protein O-mannosyl-transferase